MSLAIAAALISGVTAVALRAQPLGAQDQPGFSATSDLVVLNLRVTDRRGAYVAGLPEDAFTIFEDGRPQRIHAFAAEDAPVTVGLIVDSSISMFQLRDLLVESAVAFAKASHPNDEMFALAFNDRPWPALPPDAPFTTNPIVLGRALAGVIQPRGRTGLFDGIAAGLDYAARGTYARKVLIVVSDGGDNASTTTSKDLVARLQASSVVLHTVALVDEVDRQADPKMLKTLADTTGGEAFRPRTVQDVRSALQAIAKDIRHAYTIGFQPAKPIDGRYHQLRVAAAAPGRGSLVVKTRSGYLGMPRHLGLQHSLESQGVRSDRDAQ